MTNPALPASFRLDAASRRLALDPRDPSFFQDPYPAYAALHSSAPVVHWEEIGGLAVVDHALISALLRDRRFGRVLPADASGRPDRSAEPPHISSFTKVEANSLLDLEPPTHTRLRGLVARAFVSRRIEALEPRIAELANALVDGFQERGAVDLVAELATPLPVIVIAELLGLGREGTQLMLGWSHKMVAMYQFGRTEEVERAANTAATEFSDFMRSAIAEKRRRPGEDLVSNLIAAESAGGRLDEDEMVSVLILLMNAGHEATVHQIGNAAKTILESGRDIRPMFADTASRARTVEEALRFDTPLHLFQRIALEDAEIGRGLTLSRGESLALLLGAGNRDPKVFGDPGRFDPKRDGPAHVSFGAGTHFCIGAPLARLELGVALATLFERLPGLKLTAPPRYRDSYHFRGLERLDVAF